ncbi:MAG: 50S ribosomal protein L4 [Chloroflexi bacterium]|nr:50S ribosomal protein L4 [Chloroflexota bacterium]
MQVPVKNILGEVVKEIAVRDDLFGVPMNEAVVHQALVRQLANSRQGTADTKIRAEVSGGGRKPRPQKGSGHSRQGSIRSPLWKGGGVTFGPHPRSYAQRMPKKMRRLALRCLLSSKVSEGQLVVVENLNLDGIKTKGIQKVLEALGVHSSVLVVTKDTDQNVVRSAQNLAWVKTILARLLNVADLLKYNNLVVTEDAVRRVEEIWGQTQQPSLERGG